MGPSDQREAYPRFHELTPAEQKALEGSFSRDGANETMGRGEQILGYVMVLGPANAEAGAMRAMVEKLKEKCLTLEMLAKIQRQIAAMGIGYQEMKTAKEELEQMRREQLFAFTKRMDSESFRILCVVLANGTVAKASRALKMKDATLRSRIAKWVVNDTDRKAMQQLIDWRKAMGAMETVPLNPGITKATAASVDFPGLLSDVLDGLLSMNPKNWEEQAELLATLLRPYVQR